MDVSLQDGSVSAGLLWLWNLDLEKNSDIGLRANLDLQDTSGFVVQICGAGVTLDLWD